MLRFFRELIDVAKEGLAEAKQELAQEKLEAETAKTAKISALKERLAQASKLERFAVALAAPYRQTFSSELRDAREEDRPPVYMLCIDISEDEIRSWTKLLARDFDVSDRQSAEAAFSNFAKLAAQITDPDGLALWTTRFCHLVSASAAVGHIDKTEVLGWLAPAADRAIDTFASWEDYSERFLTGEKTAPGSNLLGRKALGSAVNTLLSDEFSPWRLVSWPQRSAGA